MQLQGASGCMFSLIFKPNGIETQRDSSLDKFIYPLWFDVKAYILRCGRCYCTPHLAKVRIVRHKVIHRAYQLASPYMNFLSIPKDMYTTQRVKQDIAKIKRMV